MKRKDRERMRYMRKMKRALSISMTPEIKMVRIRVMKRKMSKVSSVTSTNSGFINSK